MTDQYPAPRGAINDDAPAAPPEGDAATTWTDAVSQGAAWTEILPGRWTEILSREVDDEILGEAA